MGRVSTCQKKFNTIDLRGAQVNQGNGLSMEKQGNLGEFTKQLREFLTTPKPQAILREWLWQI